MTICLLIIVAITAYQSHGHYQKLTQITHHNWDNNQFKAHCPILGQWTDQDNASHFYLLMIIIAIISMVLATIIAFNWLTNRNPIEFIIGILIIITRLIALIPALIIKIKA